MDTGASHHLTGNIEILTDVRDIAPVLIILADGRERVSVKEGTVVLGRNLILKSVLYVEGCSDLISLTRLMDENRCIMQLADHFIVVQDRCSRMVTGAGKRVDGTFHFRSVETETAAVVTVKDEKSFELWHNRMGHPSARVVALLPDVSFSVSSEISNKACEVCLRAKQCRTTFPASMNKTKRVFELIHTDLWGPYRTATHSGARYFLTVVDDFSRCVWIYLLKEKSEAPNCLKNFVAMAARQFEAPVQTVRSDNISKNRISPTDLSSDSDIPLNLNTLILEYCEIKEFPKFIKNLQKLEDLALWGNKLKGKVPGWLWSLPRLTLVDLIDNLFSRFEGSTQVLMNSSVKLLFLDSNRFQGAIPNLPFSINAFSAMYNDFTGNIPLSSVCNRNSLKLLDLSYNNFTSPIPHCLSNLEVVRLRKNNFEGSLPDMFYDGSLLRTLDVGYNHLTGKLPRSLVNFSSLKFLSAENNIIEDTFPFWLKTLTELHVLILRSNRFFGEISPPDHDPLGFPELHILEISNNNFTGNLPANYFENWKTPSLKRNEFGSFYPVEYMGGRYYFEEYVDLVYKGLHMESHVFVTSYSAIDLSGNRIEGQIPESIGQLKALIALNLSNNVFTGHIPLSLGNAKVLESLDLSRNQLSGSIPNELVALSSLAYINVSNNQLQGEIPQGTQITGQPKSSFEGNPWLCGFPLEQSCFGTSAPPIQYHTQQKEDEEVLHWKAVTIGYAYGVLLGMAIGKVFSSHKPEGNDLEAMK